MHKNVDNGNNGAVHNSHLMQKKKQEAIILCA